MAKNRLDDVVILLPGITGSVLQRGDRVIWGASGSGVWNLLTQASDLDLGTTQNARDTDDGIEATGLIADVHLIPGLVKIDGYSGIARMIAETFEVRQNRRTAAAGEPANYIEFPYDWRKDNRIAARQLQALAEQSLQSWRTHTGKPEAKLILLAHSMGGLVARYYLEVLNGWRDCKALITFGTPYRGSVKALDFLANGYKMAVVNLTAAVRSFPSVYQLLPTYPMLQVSNSWGRVVDGGTLPNVNAERAREALAFHQEIEDAVTANRRNSDYLLNGYQLIPIVGIRQATPQSATLTDGVLEVSNKVPSDIDELLEDGDGTVPRLSAIPIELSDDYRDTFVAGRHASLQEIPSILDDIAGLLQGMQVVGLAGVRDVFGGRRAAGAPAIALELDDLYQSGEPIEIWADLIDVPEADGAPLGLIERTDGNDVVLRTSFARSSDRWRLVINGLGEGIYRIQVSAANVPRPISDVFAVASLPQKNS